MSTVRNLNQRLVHHQAQKATPRWIALVIGSIAGAIGVLTAFFEYGDLERIPSIVIPAWPAPLSLFAISTVVIAWLIEARGMRWPRLLFVLLVIGPVVWLMMLGRDTFAPLFLMLLTGWMAYVDTRRNSLLTLALGLISIHPPLLYRNTNYEDWITWSVGMIFAWTSLYAVATQQRLLAELRATQADLVRQLAAEERRQIAREVHDVVAHSLAVTMLHLTGARHILQRDPQRAAEALAQAEHLGRQSLTDIRRLVGLLSADSETTRPMSTLPGAADIADLVATYTHAGLDVDFTITGDPARLSPATGLDVYRISQEALTNVVKHAPGARAHVKLDIGDTILTLQVRNTRSQPGLATPTAGDGVGTGITGMRERATILGGTLFAYNSGDGWLVECIIPLPKTRAATML